jgi:predicted Zn-dependent peptidase
MNIQTHTFSNNIRLLHVHDSSEVGYAGVIVNTGTRDEQEHEGGFAHLAEHMLFKGTHKRNSTQIINRIEDVGGELNAYTTKEETVVYSVFLKKYLSLAIDLLADVVFDSIVLEDELKKEVDVVIDEIHSYMDSPSELIVDDFEDLLFNQYAIGRNILGTEDSLKQCTPESLKDFIKRTYTTDEMVFFTLGDFSIVKVIRTVGKCIEKIPATNRTYARETPTHYSPTKVTLDKKTLQAHYILGNRAYSVKDEKRFAFYLLNNILGGQGMNSRFNMSLREKSGLVYTVESHFTPYSDTGLWSVYFGTDHTDVPKALRLIHQEIKKIKENELTEVRLQKAKTQFLSQLIISGENKENWIISKAKQFLNFGHLMQQAEIESRIMTVSSQQLCAVANESFQEEAFTHLRYC